MGSLYLDNQECENTISPDFRKASVALAHRSQCPLDFTVFLAPVVHFSHRLATEYTHLVRKALTGS
uniref:Uncharacterized protein n=1 Tax=Anguilla anguilla TaxID=7936 RepID=A0A0E9SA82_ANGAN